MAYLLPLGFLSSSFITSSLLLFFLMAPQLLPSHPFYLHPLFLPYWGGSACLWNLDFAWWFLSFLLLLSPWSPCSSSPLVPPSTGASLAFSLLWSPSIFFTPPFHHPFPPARTPSLNSMDSPTAGPLSYRDAIFKFYYLNQCFNQ